MEFRDIIVLRFNASTEAETNSRHLTRCQIPEFVALKL